MPSIHPVSVSRHGARHWLRYSSYSFAAQDAVCPLVVQELSRAVMNLPVAFVESGDDFVLVAVLGLQPGRNLFVAPDGRWLGAYVPALYRGYPFVLASAEDGQQVLCIDEESGLLVDAGGEPLFDEGGKPVKALTDVLDFLGQVAGNRQLTQRACALLKEHGLIQPWSIQVQAGEGEKTLTGLFRIDEAALNALSADALLVLRDAGALSLAYCQLLSQQHLSSLGQLAQAHARLALQAETPQPAAEIDLEFLNRSETIGFGNL